MYQQCAHDWLLLHYLNMCLLILLSISLVQFETLPQALRTDDAMTSKPIVAMNHEVAGIDTFESLFQEEIDNLTDDAFAESLEIMVGMDKRESYVSDEAQRKRCDPPCHYDDMGIYVQQALGLCNNVADGVRNKRKRLALPSWYRNSITKRLERCK